MSNKDLSEAYRLGRELGEYIRANKIDVKDTNTSFIVTKGSESVTIPKYKNTQLKQQSTFR